MWSLFEIAYSDGSGRINLNVWNDPPSCKRIPHESYEIVPFEKRSPLNQIVLVRRTIDNRRGKLLTNLVGPWMNRVEEAIQSSEAEAESRVNRRKRTEEKTA